MNWQGILSCILLLPDGPPSSVLILEQVGQINFTRYAARRGLRHVYCWSDLYLLAVRYSLLSTFVLRHGMKSLHDLWNFIPLLFFFFITTMRYIYHFCESPHITRQALSLTLLREYPISIHHIANLLCLTQPHDLGFLCY